MTHRSICTNKCHSVILATMVLAETLVACGTALADVCPSGVWEMKLNGYMETMTMNPGTSPCTASHHHDGEPATAVPSVSIERATISFAIGGMTYTGIVSGNQMLGTAQDGSGTTYSWSGARTTSDQGLVELGDFNHDGRSDNKDIVDFISSIFGIRFHSYRLCDDEYNPGCFDLLETAMRPDGLPKEIAPDRFGQLGIAAAPFPPDQYVSIRQIGSVLMRYPRSLIEAIIRSRDWTIDLSGFMVRRGRLNGLWKATANGHPALLLIWPEAAAGHIQFGTQGWEPLADVVLTRESWGANDYPTIRFDRVLASGRQQYKGFITHVASGVLGNQIEGGTFTEAGVPYQWSATGPVRPPGQGLSYLTVVANGQQGQLRIRLGAGYYKAKLIPSDDPWHHANLWEELRDVQVIGTSLSFLRPSANQRFRATITDNVMNGSFADGSHTFGWHAEPLPFSAGTSFPECKSTPEETIGDICRTSFFGGPQIPRTVSQELITHPTEYALRNGRPPFSNFDQEAYQCFGFRRPGTSFPARPGFVSDYAANDSDVSHDLVETIDFYVLDPGTLWRLAHDDIRQFGSSLLWRKREFVRTRIIHDAPVNGLWDVNVNGHRGTLNLSVTTAPTRLAAAISTLNLSGVDETITQIQFNGETISFQRTQRGVVEQTYIGVLRGNLIRGFFTHAEQAYEWTAAHR